MCVYACMRVYIYFPCRERGPLCAREAFSGPPRPQCGFYLAVTLVDRVDPALDIVDSLEAARTGRTSSWTIIKRAGFAIGFDLETAANDLPQFQQACIYESPIIDVLMYFIIKNGGNNIKNLKKNLEY